MDLNQIQLPAGTIADLYKNVLVGQPVATTPSLIDDIAREEPAQQKNWKWLGENKRQVLVLVHYENAVHLPDQPLQFLTAMLGACKLNLGDIAIVNRQHQPAQNYKEYIEKFEPRIALLFGIEPADFGLPMNFPSFQIQAFAGCSFLQGPTLDELENDKVLKSKMWVSLRRLFNI